MHTVNTVLPEIFWHISVQVSQSSGVIPLSPSPGPETLGRRMKYRNQESVDLRRVLTQRPLPSEVENRENDSSLPVSIKHRRRILCNSPMSNKTVLHWYVYNKTTTLKDMFFRVLCYKSIRPFCLWKHETCLFTHLLILRWALIPPARWHPIHFFTEQSALCTWRSAAGGTYGPVIQIAWEVLGASLHNMLNCSIALLYCLA